MSPNVPFRVLLSVVILGFAPLPDARSASSFESISVASNVAYLGFSSAAGSNYLLEFTTDLVSDTWTPTGGILTATGSTTVAQDAIGLSVHRAYRVVVNPPLVTLECVPVGNAGNTNDPGGGMIGAVSYDYEIGATEVSNDEYARFLNAVDPDGLNALALYNDNMSGTFFVEGGITNNAGNPAGSKYEVSGGFADRPIVFVSFYDTMRFCNWLHNGAQPGGDTEDGAYTLLGGTAVPSNAATVTRNPGAAFVVPSDDEWYKAAYHEPAGAGGDVDDYWLYPTRSNTAPTPELPPGGSNSANYGNLAPPAGPGTTTEGGAYASATSFYGTLDQAGNVWEWSETIRTPGARVIWGGSFEGAANSLRSTGSLDFFPDGEAFSFGFRVAKP